MQVHLKAIAVSNILVHQRCAQIRSCYAALMCQLVQNRFSRIHRDSKANALYAADSNLRTVDADNLAVCIHQRTAAVAGVDGCVRLNQVELALTDFNAAVQGADNTGRHAAAELHAQRIADSNSRLADLQGIAVAKLCHRQIIQIDFHHSQVGYGICAQHLALDSAAVRQADDDFARALDNVVIRRDIAGLIIDNAAACTALGQLHAIEEVTHIGLVRNADNSRTNLFRSCHNRRIACRTELLLRLHSRLVLYSSRGFAVAAACNKNCCA